MNGIPKTTATLKLDKPLTLMLYFLGSDCLYITNK